MPGEIFEAIIEGIVSESIGSVIRNPLSNFLWFPYKIVGALLVFVLDSKKRKFKVVLRLPTAKYYGLIVVAVILFTWFFFAFL